MSSMSRSQARTMRRIWFTSPLLLPEAATGHRAWGTPGRHHHFLYFKAPFWCDNSGGWATHSKPVTWESSTNLQVLGWKWSKRRDLKVWQNPPGTCCGPKKRQPVSQFAERPRRSFNSPTSYFSWSKSWPGTIGGEYAWEAGDQTWPVASKERLKPWPKKIWLKNWMDLQTFPNDQKNWEVLHWEHPSRVSIPNCDGLLW